MINQRRRIKTKTNRVFKRRWRNDGDEKQLIRADGLPRELSDFNAAVVVVAEERED